MHRNRLDYSGEFCRFSQTLQTFWIQWSLCRFQRRFRIILIPKRTEYLVISVKSLIAWKGELFQRRDLNIQTIAGIALLTPAVCQRHNNEPHKGRKLEVSLVIVSQNGMRFLVMENSCIRGDASKVAQLYFTRQGQLTAVIRHCSAYKTLRKVLQHC